MRLKVKSINKVKSILYVEDEKNIQEELAEVIGMFCEELYLADDGVQGLKQYKEHHCDIVISDIKMPFMDGIEMSKKIKEIDNDAHIVFTTAFSDVEFFQEALKLQVDGYILKPMVLELLEKKIKAIIATINLKEELEQKEQMLIQQSKLASMGEMIGNVVHQWKQPLSGIAMSANNLKVDCALDNIQKETLEHYADDILTQIQYLSKTIDDFRNFFKPSQNVNMPYNLKEYIIKCVDLVGASFHDNFIETISDIDDKINSYGNPDLFSQALVNIFNNAKDALSSAKGIQEKLMFIVTAKEDDKNNIILTIRDNAGGIPQSIIGKVFDPYFTTKGVKGTGLGLHITQTIITKNLKGEICVKNEEFEYEGKKYKGASFVITLPLYK